jgi:hypothetical protein
VPPIAHCAPVDADTHRTVLDGNADLLADVAAALAQLADEPPAYRAALTPDQQARYLVERSPVLHAALANRAQVGGRVEWGVRWPAEHGGDVHNYGRSEDAARDMGAYVGYPVVSRVTPAPGPWTDALADGGA